MIPVRLFIVSTINQDEKIEQEIEGQLIERDHEWLLRYVENEGSADEIRTTVKVEEEKATVIRQGAISYRQTYYPGRRTYTQIELPGGRAEMEVHTLEYKCKREKGCGEIQVSFSLDMEGEKLGDYQLYVKWQSHTLEKVN